MGCFAYICTLVGYWLFGYFIPYRLGAQRYGEPHLPTYPIDLCDMAMDCH